jgi:TonB-dependent SusC/RagA subfamily outer membrane receptor
MIERTSFSERDMTRRLALFTLALSLAACSSDRLTGVAAENAARQYQAQHLVPSGDPLFILDGKEVGAGIALALNPASIESIEVVKGAAATAEYGERGSRGVILITRKPTSGGGAR